MDTKTCRVGRFVVCLSPKLAGWSNQTRRVGRSVVCLSLKLAGWSNQTCRVGRPLAVTLNLQNRDFIAV